MVSTRRSVKDRIEMLYEYLQVDVDTNQVIFIWMIQRRRLLVSDSFVYKD